MTFGITQAKSIFTSKTFWGSIIALITILFPAHIQNWMAAIGITDSSVIVDKIIGGLGAVFAVYGRLAAKQPAALVAGPVVVPIKPIAPVAVPPATPKGGTV